MALSANGLECEAGMGDIHYAPGMKSQWQGWRSLYHPALALNGVAECTRVLTNAARTMLYNAGLLDSLWAEVFNSDQHITAHHEGAKWTYPI